MNETRPSLLLRAQIGETNAWKDLRLLARLHQDAVSRGKVLVSTIALSGSYRNTLPYCDHPFASHGSPQTLVDDEVAVEFLD